MAKISSLDSLQAIASVWVGIQRRRTLPPDVVRSFGDLYRLRISSSEPCAVNTHRNPQEQISRWGLPQIARCETIVV
jgi:hypothetical protein